MNRYTRLSTAKYNPMSLQELMMVPLAKRKQHDSSIAQAMKMGLFENQAAGTDRAVIDKVKGEYEGSINDYVDQLNKEGVSSSTTQGLINLSRSRKELETKYLNPAQANYQAMQEYKKQVMETKEWSPQLAQAYAAQQLGAFKGTFNEDGTTNSFAGRLLPNYIDPNKRLDDAIANIGDDAVQSELEQYGVHSVYDLMKSKKVTGKTKNKIIASLGAELQGDSAFLNSYRTEAGLQGMNEFDANGNLKIGKFNDDGSFSPQSRLGLMLYGKASGASSQKETYTLKELSNPNRVAAAKSQIEEAKSGATPFTSLPDERFQVYNKSFTQEVGKIGSVVDTGRPLPPKSDSMQAQKRYLEQYERWEKYGGGSKPYTVDMMPAEEKEKYTDIYNKLSTAGIVPAGANINSPEAAKAISEYMGKYEEASYSNSLIMPYAEGLSSNEAALVISTDNKKASQLLKTNIEAGLTKVWDEQGNAIEFDPEELAEMDLQYLGYVSPNNYIDTFKEANPKETVMPHMFKGADGKRYYASRNESETKTPRFSAGTLIKQATYTGAMQPELPVEHVPDARLQQVGISNVITKFNPLTKTYDLTVLRGGQVFYKNEAPLDTKSFNELIYKMYQ